MLAEAFPRLAIRLRSTFPDAQIKLAENARGMRVSFPAFPAWEVEVTAAPCHEQFQVLQSSILLHYECLQDIPVDDFHRLISAENLGLRGATLLVDKEHGRRAIRIRSSFIGQKGRTRDEAENIAIDTLSMLRFARLLEDRILRSVANDRFSYEMYYSQYLSKSIGRNRYINYARSIFQGSTERVFGQVAGMLKEDYKYKVNMSQNFIASITPPGSDLEIILRIPEEIPMLTCSASLHMAAWDPEKSFELVARLNPTMTMGHFEVNADGSLISFVAWKHLTNDLRYYSLDQMIASVHEAERVLYAELPELQETRTDVGDTMKAHASSLDAYKNAA
jgi:hypothetical protein